MKGLSFSQPWLWAVFDPTADKDVENRWWPAPMSMIDEQFACHAAKSYDADGLHALCELGCAPPVGLQLPKSAIVGAARIDRVVTSPKTLTPAQRRWYMGDDDGLRMHPAKGEPTTVYGHILVNRVALPTPIPWDGALGFWQVPPLIEAEILFQSGTALGHLRWQSFVDELRDLLEYQRQLFRDWAGDTLIDKVKRYDDLNRAHGAHRWFDWRSSGDPRDRHAHRPFLTSCAVCGILKPPDTAKRQPRCKGVVPLTMRGAA